MPRPLPPEWTLPDPFDLPEGRMEAFKLDGGFPKQDAPPGTLRGVKILAEASLDDDQAYLARTLLLTRKSYGDDPARCFLPRHGLRITTDTTQVDILLCLECRWAYFYFAAEPLRPPLSERGQEVWERFFRAVF